MIHGTLYDGKTSQAFPATVDAQAEFGLILRFADKSHFFTWNDIKISERLGNTARFIELGEFGRFETNDNAAVDEISLQHPDHQNSQLLHRLETSPTWVSIAVAITIIFSLSFIKWGIPWISDNIAYSIPDNVADSVEEQLFNQLDQRLFNPSELTADRQTDVEKLYAQAISQLDLENKNYEFLIRKGSNAIGANAFAFPSGKIVMTDQLIELADNDTQIAGVIAHEIGHLELKHSLRQLIRGSILTILVAWISGDVSGALATVIATPVAFLELNYSREFEMEADRYAIRYFQCDFTALEQMALFFDKLDASHSFEITNEDSKDKTVSSDFFSTHPATEKRMAMLRDPHNHSECF